MLRYRERVGRAFAFIPLTVICIAMYKVSVDRRWTISWGRVQVG